jgi:predicted RNA-binding protein YlxR (DUF448 family)
MTRTVTCRIGRPKSPVKMLRVQYNLDEPLIQAINARSKKQGRSAWVRAALWEAINK